MFFVMRGYSLKPVVTTAPSAPALDHLQRWAICASMLRNGAQMQVVEIE